jgi:hypothetical protein
MRTRSSQSDAIAITNTESETYQALLVRAHRRTGGVSPESIVRHVLSATQGGDWPVQRDALDAVLRRCASAHTDEIQIVRRPRGRPLGLYAMRRRGSHATPYRTLLRRIEPLDGSCECADFLRNSLGLCKHLVAVLEYVSSRRRRSAVERDSAQEPMPLRWDPVRPLTGLGDWLARVCWVDGTPDRDLRRWLRPANGGGWTVTVPDAPKQRLALLERVLGVLRDGEGEPALHALLRGERARLTHEIQTAGARKQLQQPLQTLKQSLYRYRSRTAAQWILVSRRAESPTEIAISTITGNSSCSGLRYGGLSTRLRRKILSRRSEIRTDWRRRRTGPLRVVADHEEDGKAPSQCCRADRGANRPSWCAASVSRAETGNSGTAGQAVVGQAPRGPSRCKERC